MTDDVARQSDVRRVRRESLALYAVAFAVFLAVIALAVNNRDLAHRADAAAATAAKGVEVSCTLLANVATQSGAAGGTHGLSEHAIAQKALTSWAFDVLYQIASPAQRKRFRVLNARSQASGEFVTLPKCSQVARHPETVKQLGRPKAQHKP